jgi:hypothetical protein
MRGVSPSHSWYQASITAAIQSTIKATAPRRSMAQWVRGLIAYSLLNGPWTGSQARSDPVVELLPI